MPNSIKHTIKGTVSWKIQKDGNTLRESGKYNNLILNQGLNYVAAYSFADCFNYCAVGSVGIAPVKTDTGLGSEVKRTNNYSVSALSNGATLTNNILTLFRTFSFSAEVVPVTYREVGFSPISTSGNNLFSKALLKDSAGNPLSVLIGIGETLSIRYELSIEIFDATRLIPNGIDGHSNSRGYARIQKVGLKGIDTTTGATNNYDDTNGANEPSVQSTIFVSTNGSPPEPFGSCLDRSPASVKTGSLSNYVTDSHVRKKGVMFKPSELGATIRSVGVGSAESHGAIFVFDADQTTESNKAYIVNFQYAWVHQNSSSFTNWLFSEDALYLNKRLNKVNTYAYFAL